MRTFAVFVHADNIEAGTAQVAIKRYAKLHPEAKIEQIKAVNVIAIKMAKDEDIISGIVSDALVSSGAITPEQKAKVEAI